MQLELKTRPIGACELLLNTTVEHPFECDVLLPDYCPDIMRVLCCQVECCVPDGSVRGQSLLVEGMANVQLCYVGEAGVPHKVEYKIPFSKSFELPCDPRDPHIHLRVEPGFVNCRATARRRFDIRGTLSICARVSHCAMQQAVTGATGGGVELKTTALKGVRPAGQVVRQLSIREELTPPMGKKLPEEILRMDCAPVLHECKISGNRAVLRGDMAVHLLYKTDRETGELESCDYHLPLSQMVELDNLPTDCQCEAQAFLIGAQCSREGEEERQLLEAQLGVVIRLLQGVETTVATDGFSTAFQSEAQSGAVQVPQLVGMVQERATAKCEAAPPDNLLSVEDVWVQLTRPNFQREKGKAVASCQVNFTVLCKVEEIFYQTISCTGEASVQLPTEEFAGELDFTPFFFAAAPACQLNNGKLLLSCEVGVSGTLLGLGKSKLITDIVLDEQSPIQTDSAVGMVICFASPGETVWDIAKRYKAPPGRIIDENALDTEQFATRTALIIPT